MSWEGVDESSRGAGLRGATAQDPWCWEQVCVRASTCPPALILCCLACEDAESSVWLLLKLTDRKEGRAGAGRGAAEHVCARKRMETEGSKDTGHSSFCRGTESHQRSCCDWITQHAKCQEVSHVTLPLRQTLYTPDLQSSSMEVNYFHEHRSVNMQREPAPCNGPHATAPPPKSPRGGCCCMGFLVDLAGYVVSKPTVAKEKEGR